MPDSCKECPCREYGEFSYESDWCCLNGEDIKDINIISSKCPLIMLPQHGDLIDRNALKYRFEQIYHPIVQRAGFPRKIIYKEDIDNAPVIIKAED